MKVTLDRERELAVNLNSLGEFEEITGKRFFSPNAFESFTTKDYTVLIWACLKEEDPELTMEQVGKMVDIPSLSKIITAIGNFAKEGESTSPL